MSYRLDIITDLEELSNIKWQEDSWLRKDTPYYFYSTLEGFLNRTEDDLKKALYGIGGMYYDKYEAIKVYELREIVSKIDHEVSSDDFAAFYNHPKWPEVVELAKYAYLLLRSNSRKYFLFYLKDFLEKFNLADFSEGIEFLPGEIFYDKEELSQPSRIRSIASKIYEDVEDYNKFENFQTHPKWPELVEIVKTTLEIFEANNQKHGFEQTIQEIELAAKKQEQFEVRQKAAELLWKKFVNWHKYRRQRRMFSRN
jgi:hypothetical protein